ncbi:MAG TPA: OmpA family protein, partial [Polyangiaceae bacterium]|nr:OmpA family protein [Polyangiaceae bacterium]
PLFHFGVGGKVYLNDDVLMRLDLRDNMTQKYAADDGKLTHSPELLVGVSMTLGRAKQAPAAPCPKEDTDGDGIVDAKDRCPNEASDSRDGCPVLDRDADGVLDDTDKCPDTKGVAPTGCPADADEDGVVDEQDKCPNQKGVAPDGCPAPEKDTDADGIVDAKDKCPKEAETQNGFEDSDGCPDVIPEKVKAFTGVIQGINFDHNKATIRPESKPTLDKAAVVLKEFPALRVAISGHTDNTGPRDKNVVLSQERAEAVKKYLASQGVTEDRIETRGAGPDEPIDTNATQAGRARNRRIEFKLISEK